MGVNRYKVSLCLIFYTCILAGCASAPQQKFDKNAHANIKTIALLQIPEPVDYHVINFGGAGGLLGPLGGLAQAGDNISKGEKFTQTMRLLKLNMSERLTRELEGKLINAGYKVVILHDQRPGVEDSKKADYSKIQTDADAILDVWYLAVGYLSPANSLDYQPWIRVSSRLVSAKNKSQIYFQLFDYGAGLGSSKKIIHYPGNGKHAYRSFDALISSAAEAGDGLVNSIPTIANGIASQL